ncbi:MAG: hypothetical protein IPM55_21545 [Acidobacteria bacterium]|nr:hypothetical protein [Acidobacteriota bacterium]
MLCDAHRIDVFVDVHSFSEFVLFPWGHAPTQTTQPLLNFTSLLMGFCLTIDPPGHQESMPPTDQLKYQTVATRVADAIRAVRGRNYVLETIYQVYNGTTTGTTSTMFTAGISQIPHSGKRSRLHLKLVQIPERCSLVVPAGRPGADQTDTKAGLVALIQQSVCAIEFIGETLQAGTVQPPRRSRRTVGSYRKGRGWIELVTSVQSGVAWDGTFRQGACQASL